MQRVNSLLAYWALRPVHNDGQGCKSFSSGPELSKVVGIHEKFVTCLGAVLIEFYLLTRVITNCCFLAVRILSRYPLHPARVRHHTDSPCELFLYAFIIAAGRRREDIAKPRASVKFFCDGKPIRRSHPFGL